MKNPWFGRAASQFVTGGFAAALPLMPYRVLALALVSITALVPPAAAATAYWDINGATPGAGGTAPAGTWDAGNTNWSSSAAGDVATAAWTAGDTGVFAAGTDATGTYTVTVSGTQDIGGLTFEEGTVTLSGGSLRMVADSIFDVATGRSATIGDTVTLSNDVARTLTKTGSGTLTVGTSRTYTGETIVNAGRLILRSNSGQTFSSPLTINSSGTVELNALNTGGHTYGVITVNTGGLLSLGPAGNNVSIRPGTLILNGGTVGRHTGFNGLSVTGTITAAGETTSTITAPFIALSNNQTINIDVKSASTLLMSGGISPGAASGVKLTKRDPGTLILSAASTYQGLTTVSAGVLNIRGNAALGTTAAGTTVTSNAALEVQGGITVGAEALTLNGAGITSGGALRNISGDNTYGGAITLDSAARINSDAGTLTLNVASGNAVAGAHALTFGGAGNITVADPIATSSITKDGVGTLLISGSNGSFAGPTTISAGTLAAATSTALGGGAVSIASGASLRLEPGAILANAITTTSTGSIVFAGGGLQRASNQALSTAAQLVAGGTEASVALDPAFAWSARIADVTYSDVLGLTNTNGTVQILQLTYDESLLGGGSEADMLLGWNSSGSWVNAIDGNTGSAGGSALPNASGSYAALGIVPTADYLGSWGRDTTTNTAWAVVNHNSDFAAIVVVPEPPTSPLVAAGLIGLVVYGWRQRK
jgi:autotransporter-associated beta strand protein